MGSHTDGGGRSAGRVGRRRAASLVLVALLLAGVSCSSRTVFTTPEVLPEPFPAGSYWTTPLPEDAPLHPESERVIEFLRDTNSRDGCVTLVGAGDNSWGTPVYWVQEGDPVYDVTSDKYEVPPEYGSLRIPLGARPAPNRDSEMIVYDSERGYATHLSKAAYEEGADRWTVTGGSIVYLDSNGLDGRLPEADDLRNFGSFRGYNGVAAVVRHDEVEAGEIQHVLKLAVAESANRAVWPMLNSDGDSSDPAAPPQGTRIRIKASVDLADYDLHPQVEVVARALQEYGAIIGDSSGGPIALKLEDTITEGRGQLWDFDPDAMCEVPIEAFEVVALEYSPPGVR